MKCPACKEVDLVMAGRQGVEIDYCPTCRGVWLDRGELDKIIERSGIVEASKSGGYVRGFEHDHHDEHHGREGYGKHSDYKGRRKSWLSELFD